MSKIKIEKVLDCLNCGGQLEENAAFCQNCGQATKTRRFSIQEFFKRDLIQTVFSYEKGFFFSFKQLFRNPGKMVHEYIEGKWAYHVPFGSFYMIILGFMVLFSYFSELQLANDLKIDEGDLETRDAFDFIDDSPKIINIIQIPIMAVFSWIVFWKAPLNFSEHLVVSFYRGALELVFLTVPSILGLLYANLFIQQIGYYIGVVFSAVYSIWLYIGLFRNYYQKNVHVTILSLVCYVLFIFLGGLIMMLSLKFILSLKTVV